MKLYTNLERIYRELGELGKTVDDPLSVDELCAFDQLHYHGTQALDVAMAVVGIDAQPRLLENCHRLLPPGGCFYTEDLTARGDIEDAQLKLLERELYAITLRRIDQYRQDLENAGFVVELCKTMSSEWAEFVRVRLAAYRADRGRHLRVHGEAAVIALTDFYSAVNRHFQSGKLGGLRLCARKPEVAV